jgi:hypothetical protein
MTRVIPPRESMPTEAAVLRRSKPTFWRWSMVRSAVLRAAGILLLAKAALYWLTIFGADGTNFLAMPQQEQARLVALAIVSTMSGVGLWMLALWGVALWLMCLVLELVPLGLRTAWQELAAAVMNDRLVLASVALLVIFILAALLSAIEAGRRGNS